ncbi:hypothetical protein L3Q82_001860 [Scortum barcoo]|uniref:Uncharacterized protein n=1 Tax=Scortum barcoo TaxID=214431 RepID=A0ACB8W7P6_9TELE|nr:hypothetical protein L3Q82_001860 [Scortum barcoo]
MFKKAKPQPAVDIAKLLEQLFSQTRPGTAPPAARRAKASSVNASTSNVPPSSKTAPVVSAFPAASSINLSPQPQPASPNTSETPQQSDLTPTFAAESVSNVTVSPASTSPASLGSAKEITTETNVHHVVEENVETSSAAAVEPSLETTPESPVEPSVETPESRAEGPVEAAVDKIQTKDSHALNEEPLLEKTIDPPGKKPLQKLEKLLVLDLTVDLAAETESANSGAVNISHSATVKPSLDTTVEPPVESTVPSPLLETAESGSAGAESPVDAQINIPDSGPANPPKTIIETTTDPSAENSTSPLETLESRAAAAAAEGSVETKIETEADTAAQVGQINSSDSGVIKVSFGAKQEPLIETTVEPAAEASTAPLESRAAASEGLIENEAADDLSLTALKQNTQESAPMHLEKGVEVTVETESGNVTVEENKSEQMTLESVTLHAVEVQVESLRTDELLQAKSVLDEKAEKQLEELLVEMTPTGATETGNSSEGESESLTKVLSKWDSLSGDLQELEGESGMLVNELLCHVPAVKTSSASDPPAGASGEPSQTEEKGSEAEAITLKSLTLAAVKAEVGGFKTEVLLETRNRLEKEAEVRAKEEKMEVATTTEEDVAVFEDTMEAEILALDSISEATDVIEAETAVMLEAMFGSEQGPKQPSDTGDTQKLKQEAEKEESGEQEGSVREAMSLESVTLAEVEASLGALENETLSETADYLEKEAEILAGEKKVEVEDVAASEEATEAPKIESLSEADDLPEALQMDALMEELLFSVPEHVKREKEGQEAARENNLDAAAGVGSVDVDTAAAVMDDFPAVEEVVLGQDSEEKTSENEDGEGTHTDLDPVQKLFLEKIREYNMRRLNGGLLEAEPDYEKHLSEETAKLQRLYGGGDLSSFPEVTFTGGRPM